MERRQPAAVMAAAPASKARSNLLKWISHKWSGLELEPEEPDDEALATFPHTRLFQKSKNPIASSSSQALQEEGGAPKAAAVAAGTRGLMCAAVAAGEEGNNAVETPSTVVDSGTALEGDNPKQEHSNSGTFGAAQQQELEAKLRGQDEEVRGFLHSHKHLYVAGFVPPPTQHCVCALQV